MTKADAWRSYAAQFSDRDRVGAYVPAWVWVGADEVRYQHGLVLEPRYVSAGAAGEAAEPDG